MVEALDPGIARGRWEEEDPIGDARAEGQAGAWTSAASKVGDSFSRSVDTYALESRVRFDIDRFEDWVSSGLRGASPNSD